jgi:hypothetical protein
MRLKSTLSSRHLALVSVVILCSTLAAFTVGRTSQGKKASMNIEDANKQVRERLDAFRKTHEMTELRQAASLIERIEVSTLPEFQDRQTARSVKLSLWLILFDTIDSAKDPEFDPADVPAARVSVPPDTAMKPGVPIVTPEGIADPEARRTYEEAVRVNADKTTRYRFQKELRQLDSELTARADAYITTAHLRSPLSLKEMNQAIAAHVHNDERAAHLRSLVTPR